MRACARASASACVRVRVRSCACVCSVPANRDQRWELPIHLLDAVFYASRGRLSLPDFRASLATDSILNGIRDAVDRGVGEYAVQRSPHLE